MEVEPITSPLIIGYYPFRGKAQMMRLICEYLHYPYVDRFFDPDEWKEFKEKETKGWVIKDMPYLQHDDFVVTGDLAMVAYVMELCNRDDLSGKTLEDKAKMDFMKSKSLRDTMLSLLCNERVTTKQEEMEKRQQIAELYEKKICHIMQCNQRECIPNNFYLGYLTFIDFGIYEMINNFRVIFPGQIGKYTKLVQIRDRVAAIPEIAAYEASDRCVKQNSPVNFFKRFKEQKIRASRELSSNSSTNSVQMTLE